MLVGSAQDESHFFLLMIRVLPGDCVFLHMLLHQTCSKFSHIHLNPLQLLLRLLVKHGLACNTDGLYKIVVYTGSKIAGFFWCRRVMFLAFFIVFFGAVIIVINLHNWVSVDSMSLSNCIVR